MKKLELSQLRLMNFKKVTDKTFKFSEQTFIFGANETGKTTLNDAFTWLFFDKDSQGRTAFEIKPLNKDNQTKDKIETTVEAVILIDGVESTIRKVLKEKWVKKRNAIKAEFKGNTNEFYWNEVPVTAKEFQDKISLIIDEDVFKLITNPLTFSLSEAWGDRKLPMWQNRRAIISSMVDPISNETILKEIESKDNASFIGELALELNSGKSIEDLRKQYTAQRRKLNDDIKSIPTRIDEVIKNKPDVSNFEELEIKKAELESRIEKIDLSIADKLKADKANNDKMKALQDELFSAEKKQREIKNQVEIEVEKNNKPNPKIAELEADIKRIFEFVKSENLSIKSLKSELDGMISKKESLVNAKKEKVQEWHKVNEVEFKEGDSICPTCQQELDSESIRQNKIDFNIRKSNKIREIESEGLHLKNQIQSIEKQIEETGNRIKLKEDSVNEKLHTSALYEEELKELKAVKIKPTSLELELLEIQEYQDLSKKIADINEALNNREGVDTSELTQEKQGLNDQLFKIIEQLSFKSQLENAAKRIEELENQESELANKMTEIEGKEFTIQQFIKVKISSIENQVNEKFDFVQFKLFKTLINGEEEPCCEPLINGVPFSDANTASKINAGIDIINTLCNHFKVTAPIFIDNRESVTKLIESQSQLINLIVSPKDAELRVENSAA